MFLPLTVVALLAGGSGSPWHRDSRVPAAITAPSASVPIKVTGLTLPLHSHSPQACPSQSPACASGEPALSLTQIRKLAKVFKINVQVTSATKESPVTLNLELQNRTARVVGIGLPTMYVQQGESYYSASSVLGFLGQANTGAYFTAVPRLQFRTVDSTVDLGTLPPEKLKLFFAGMTYSFAQALLPQTFSPKSTCIDCDVPGVMTMTWSSQPPERFHTNVRPGEVVMLLTYAPHSEPDNKTPYTASVGIVEPGGVVGFPVPKRPTRIVTDPTQLQPTATNDGNGVLLRITNTPLGHMSQGIVPAR